MKASQMLILTDMLSKLISEVDDIRQMINDMKMKEMESQIFTEEQ